MLNNPLIIIDTPGFGDTKGISHDKQIKDMIGKYLESKDGLHAICFVIKSSVNRLT